MTEKEKIAIAKKMTQEGCASYLPEEFKTNKNIMLVVVKENGLALEYASDELRSDKEKVIAIIKQNMNSILYVSEELKKDPELWAAILKEKED